MIKRLLVYWDNFLYKVLIKNLLKLSKLGYGVVVSGAESGANFEHMYNNCPKGSFIIGRYIDKILLNLPAVHATRGRKDNIKQVLWNEIQNNKILGRRTRVLDLASGGARYLRELAEEHQREEVESLCIDKDILCVKLGRNLAGKEKIRNIRYVKGDIFKLSRLRFFSSKATWIPNVVIASGLFIYFNNEIVEKMISEIYSVLPEDGLIIFSSYEKLNTKKLMRKTMSTSGGEEWTLYYRKPEHWFTLLNKIGYRYPYIFRDHWEMNNIIIGRK